MATKQKFPYRQFTEQVRPWELHLLDVWIKHNDEKKIPWAVTRWDIPGAGVHYQLWVWGKGEKSDKADGNNNEININQVYSSGHGFVMMARAES